MAEGLSLGKQIGPLPLGVWLAVGAAGLGIGYVINRNAAKKAADAPVQLTEGGVGRGGSGFDVVEPPPPAVQPKETNFLWSKKALAWLISQGHDPTEADTATRKYIFAQPLSFKENVFIRAAIAHLGPLPEPLPPVEPTLPAPPAPSRPGAVTNLRKVSASHNQIVIAWDPTPGATDYKIIEHSALGGHNATTTETQYRHGGWGTPGIRGRQGLVPSLDHHYMVYARNGQGSSAGSAITVRTLGR